MSNAPVWDKQKAKDWYARQPWLIGCNFTPSSAANQIEFWQAETFDEETLARELSWAEAIGFNSLRVFLHDLVWEADPDGFMARLDRFLDLTSARHIRPMLVFFDDCWNPNPHIGPQPAPIPGVRNSRWWQSPGAKRVNDPGSWGVLEAYVHAVMSHLSGDERVVAWDLYNEPGNQQQGEKSFPFLRAVFDWARQVNPSQPITCGVWTLDLPAMNTFQLENSDILSFHHYGPLDELNQVITALKPFDRPMLCTEYMARGRDSRFQTHLPVFRQENIGTYNWGFVAGKTQTNYPWLSKENDPEPEPWFHEIFYRDGRPYAEEEIAAIKQVSQPLA